MAEPKIVSVITAIKFVPIQNGFQARFIFAVFSWKKKGKDFKMDVRVSPNEYNPKREFDYLKAK